MSSSDLNHSHYWYVHKLPRPALHLPLLRRMLRSVLHVPVTLLLFRPAIQYHHSAHFRVSHHIHWHCCLSMISWSRKHNCIRSTAYVRDLYFYKYFHSRYLTTLPVYMPSHYSSRYHCNESLEDSSCRVPLHVFQVLRNVLCQTMPQLHPPARSS